MTATVATTRQSRRRMIMKGAKLLRRQVGEMAARAELTSLRENRGPWSLPKKHPGTILLQKTLMQATRKRSLPKTGTMNRSIVSDTTKVVPAITIKAGRRTVELVPARTYDHMFHATKGRRTRRVYA